MSKAKAYVNVKVGKLEDAYAHREDGGVRIVGYTEEPDSSVSFAIPADKAESLAKEILEQVKRIKENEARIAACKAEVAKERRDS